MVGLDPLARPAWAALSGPQAHLAEINGRARRFRYDVNAIIACEDDGAKAVADQFALLAPGERVFAVQVADIPDVPGLTTVLCRPAVQMILEESEAGFEAEVDFELLGEDDVDAMLELAELTQPGPFRRETCRVGQFIGLRREGRLVAMAGERMRIPGYCEVSGVCTHPDARGEGLASRLSAYKAREILARGEIPFLHAWQDNCAAIRIYERLGFRIARQMNVTVFERPVVAK
ncbi:GNAT family N-acetyltransferase [Croceibacterium salegens]|uniref:GNAT family N-acetyltransferase n=1 Tax=Croceibacterium salegens TaxID=1737568 RepID=UPI000A6979C5|nr:GNAT family N-acetyltransferase [Croceibacterium salegens]